MFNLGHMLSKLVLPPELAEPLRNIKAADQRQAFTNVLLATVADVNGKPNFNLELEINDLWTRLYGLRSVPAPQGGSPVGAMSVLGKDMARIVSELSKAQMSIIKNFR